MVEINFAGLSVVVCKEGRATATVCLLDPRSIGGGEHTACLLTSDAAASPSIPDKTFYGLDGRPYGFWDLAGASVRFVSGDPFSADLSSVGAAPNPLDDPARWRSLRWLPDFFGPSGASGLSDPYVWPTQTRIAVDSGRLVARMPADGADRLARVQFCTGSGSGKRTLTAPRARARMAAVEFDGEVTVVIQSARGTRLVTLKDDSIAMCSNTSSSEGGHEDAAILAMLQSPLPIFREVTSGMSTLSLKNPNICDCVVIIEP